MGRVTRHAKLWFLDPFNNNEGPWLGGLQPPGSAEFRHAAFRSHTVVRNSNPFVTLP